MRFVTSLFAMLLLTLSHLPGPAGQVASQRLPDADWYKFTFQSVTKGRKTDQERMVALNQAVAARVNHDEHHPGVISSRQVWLIKSGWCDNVSRLVVDLARAGGYQARVLALKHTDGTNEHVVAEVDYGNKWHLLDPDHGVEYYLDDGTIAGADDLRLDQAPVRKVYDAWRSRNGEGMEGFYKGPYQVGAY